MEIITHKYPLCRDFIGDFMGISHRGTLVGVHPTNYLLTLGVAFLFLRILYDRNLDPLDLRDPQVVLQARSGDHENLSDKKTKKLHEKQEYILTIQVFPLFFGRLDMKHVSLLLITPF